MNIHVEEVDCEHADIFVGLRGDVWVRMCVCLGICCVFGNYVQSVCVYGVFTMGANEK